MVENCSKLTVLHTSQILFFFFAVLSMIQNFAFLGFGSAFFHGSVTGVGGSCDVKLNDLFTFLAYQV